MLTPEQQERWGLLVDLQREFLRKPDLFWPMSEVIVAVDSELAALRAERDALRGELQERNGALDLLDHEAAEMEIELEAMTERAREAERQMAEVREWLGLPTTPPADGYPDVAQRIWGLQQSEGVLSRMMDEGESE